MEDSGDESDSHKRIKLEEAKVEENENHKKEEEIRSNYGGGGAGAEEPEFKSPKTSTIIPPETWDKIFSDFTSTDFVSVINSCMEWNHLLGKRKTTELFPLVLPHVIPFLKANDLLACREVHKSNNLAVDKLIQKVWLSSKNVFNFHLNKTAQLSSVYHEIERISDNYALNTQLEINNFATLTNPQWDVLSYNPFMTRSICMDIQNFSSDDEESVERRLATRARLSRLLIHYGTHVRRFNATIAEVQAGIALLSMNLVHFPNLKILELSGVTLRMDPLPFRSFRVPPLRKLSHLEVRDMTAYSATSLLIGSYGEQLTTLVVEGSWLEFTRIEADVLKTLLPKLKRLRLVNIGSNALRKLSRMEMEWPLEQLQLQLNSSEMNLNEASTGELILAAISSFKGSLTLLETHVKPVIYQVIKNNRNGGNDDPDRLSPNDVIDFEVPPPVVKAEDNLALAKEAFKKLPKLEKVVFWVQKTPEDCVKSVFKRSIVLD